MRALEPKCANVESSTSKNTVALLRELPSARKAGYLYNAVCGGMPNIVRCALQAKASANTRSAGGLNQPVLVTAAFRGDAITLKHLLDAGADHGLADRDGYTALVMAARGGDLDCVQLLLSANADTNKADVLGYTPLMVSIIHRRSECVRALLPVSNLHATNHMGRTALHLCAGFGNQECLELLLPLMNDVDVRTLPGCDERGQADPGFYETPLHFACAKGQQQMARALLKRGANRTARDNRQRTPLMWAAHEHLSCMVLLVGQEGRRKMSPAEVDMADVNGATSLHLSAEVGNVKICGFLLEAGARLDAKASDGRTPLMLAQHCHPTNAALLALLSGHGPANLPGTVCDHCGKTAAQASVNNLKACSECHDARYCGAACSAAAWPGHKAACRARAKEREEKAKPKLIPPPGASGQAAASTGAS